MGLLFPAVSHNFWVAGINYGVPDIVPVVLLSVMGARAVLLAAARPTRVELAARRVGLLGFVAVAAVSGSVLYGEILGKTFKLEFGAPPYRQSNEPSPPRPALEPARRHDLSGAWPAETMTDRAFRRRDPRLGGSTRWCARRRSHRCPA